MSFERFIARRIYSDKTDDGERFSRPAVRVAMLGVAIGLAVMIVSLAVVLGFKREIKSKVVGFGGNIQVISLTQNQKYEILPINTDADVVNKIKTVGNVSHIQQIATRLGMLKTEDDFRGLTFKGVGSDYDSTFLCSCIVDGHMPHFSESKPSNEILISKKVADDLGLKVGGKVFAYFMGDESMRARRFKVTGIYVTNMDDYDKNLVFTDIYTIRKLNGWERGMSTGMEISVKDIDYLDQTVKDLHFLREMKNDSGAMIGVFSIKELAAHTFAWLDVLDMNVVMILVLMILVSAFTVVSGLLIVMLERINMIGTLKVLGATNKTVRQIFVRFSIMLVGRGMLWGNAAGLIICLMQKQFHIVSLDASTYYIDSVPIEFDWLLIVAVNVVTFMISGIVIWGSSLLISIGKPASTLRFE